MMKADLFEDLEGATLSFDFGDSHQLQDEGHVLEDRLPLQRLEVLEHDPMLRRKNWILDSGMADTLRPFTRI